MKVSPLYLELERAAGLIAMARRAEPGSDEQVRFLDEAAEIISRTWNHPDLLT